MTTLPRALFWDVDPQTLDLKKHARFVIERVLQFGRPEDLRWLLGAFDEEAIVGAVRASRRLDRKTATFWAVHFGIPSEEVTCLRKS
ncbi:MAG: hypothetical protein GX442_24530 [Candidatus Riflebacteria bacterium]|nr:hypothetical protein [Candidatus Riflebacteria bacterium]